ncbi:MAG: exodeoxyribonuclease V subunit gamma [Rhodanobacteraceae bacterium]
MFRLVTANDAARLADTLGERLTTPRGNPLIPVRVVVPQVGLQHWLQTYLAEKLGVVANIHFTPPARFAWELLRAAQPELPADSPFDADVLRWHLHALLGEPLTGTALAPVREYLGGDGDPLRRYTLSLELAHAFERMQGYRRDKLLRWECGDDTGHWQAELWRRLLPRVGGVSRAARVEAWLAAYDPEYPPGAFREKPAPPGLPAAFACFACANVSPDVLRMLAVTGAHCDVDFYLPLPSREYLGDTPRSRNAVREWLLARQGGNPLIVSQGGALGEFVELLYGYEHVQPDEEVEQFDAGIDRGTLLGRMRDDILQHSAPRGGDRRDMLPDASLQFHACHTCLREVQTLHDALLALFEADGSLQPRDIAVMMPDVAAYRPAIEAVFGGLAANDPRHVPYNLGDTGAAAHPVVQLFLDLLDAPTSRWEIDEILDVLSAPGVMRCFDLDGDAVERLSRHLREAGVRWGEDEHAREDCGGYREFSWAFGIDRLLAGFACGDVEDTLVGDTAPLADIEGATFAHLDAVLAVTATWRHLRDLSQRRQPAAEWQRELNGILDSLYQPDPRDVAETRALERVRGTLAKLADDCAKADATLPLAWPELRAFLRGQLTAPDPWQRLFTGGVTFCGMVPLRVVPFRVICLLGMHEDAFPRHARGGLDPLLADRRMGDARRGDRDVRADDRLLFLQLITAARDAFYVSWIGRDPHSNEPCPPSMVVAEVLDLLKRDYLAAPTDDIAKTARDALLPRVEPLHPFDASLFGAQGDSARSYHREWLPAAQTPARSSRDTQPFVSQPLPAADPQHALDIADLKRFFGDPARGFLEGALQLALPRDQDADADLEPLQPDEPLLRHQLATTLLARGEADADREKILLRAQGRLPPGELADAALAIARERADTLHDAIAAFTQGTVPLEDLSGVVELDDGAQLAGRLEQVYEQGLLRATAGKLNGKRAMEAWIDTLFAAAITHAPVKCRLIWIEKDNKSKADRAIAYDIKAEGAEAARTQLQQMIAAMQHGLSEPVPLFPRASWDALKRWRVRDGEAGFDDFITTLQKAVDNAGDDQRGRSDFDQPAVRMAWRGVDLAAPDAALAERLHDNARSLLPEITPVKTGARR